MTPEVSAKLLNLLNKLTSEMGQIRAESDEGQFSIVDLLILARKAAAKVPVLAAFHQFSSEWADAMMAIVESGKPFLQDQVTSQQQRLVELKRLFEQANPSAESHSPALPLPLPDEAPLVMNIESDGDILHEYLNQAHEHLDDIEQGVLALEEKPKDAKVLDQVFRAFHTFKGGAGFLNLVPIGSLAHTFESLLDLARKQELVIDQAIAGLILEGGDLLKQFVTEMQAQLTGKKPQAPFTLPTEPVKAKANAVIAKCVRPAAPANPTPAATSPPPPSVPKPAPNPAAQPPKQPTPAPAAAPAIPKNQEKGATDPNQSVSQTVASASVKVDTQKLDSLVDLVGELVIAQSFVAQHPQLKAISNQFFTRSMSQLGRITKELQRTAMSMRMVPIGSTFQKMLRVVRDVATKQQKQAQLVLSGEDTELDRTIVESIGDPLMHMIRNSVDHGIEKPEVRVAQGKPAQGTIHLRAFHQSGNIVIQIQDDGGGLNRERIFNKAVEKGLIPASAQLPNEEVFQFIFAAGFSTAEVLTDISGRGVGMDVVKRNIEKLQGKVEIESEPGKGSTFSIYLPLTLAIIEALVVSVGEERYIIPALSVRESFQLTPAMLSTVYNRGEMVKVRERLIPLLRLYEYFNIKPRSTNPSDGIVIVLEAGRAARCLLVDQLLHKQEVVIKSLGETLKRNQALAGAAILGDGRVGLILDVNALVQLKSPSLQLAA